MRDIRHKHMRAPTLLLGVSLLASPVMLDGGGGIIGHVIADHGDTVDFKPCWGPVLRIKKTRIIRTTFTCADEPPIRLR